jgi:hypothetical protein
MVTMEHPMLDKFGPECALSLLNEPETSSVRYRRHKCSELGFVEPKRKLYPLNIIGL